MVLVTPADKMLRNTVREAGRSPPPFPFIFFKPSPTVHDHGAPVKIPKICQDDQADYEGELVSLLAPFVTPTFTMLIGTTVHNHRT